MGLFSSRKRKQPTNRAARARVRTSERLHHEPLEERRLLSATPGVSELAARGAEYIPGEILVGFEGAIAAKALAGGRAAALDDARALGAGAGLAGGKIILQQAAHGDQAARIATQWQLPEGVSVQVAAAVLKNLPGVAYAEPNYILKIDDVEAQSTIPNDTRFGELWGLHNTGQLGGTADADIDAPEAWDISRGSSSIVVGVIDTGIDYTHPDLAANAWTNPGEIAGNGIDDDGNGYTDDVHGYDFANNDGDPFDDNSHGTHVSGTIGAQGNNSQGVVGVNWNVKVMGLKFLTASGSGATADAVEALNYAALMKSRGVDIKLTSNSWGGGASSTPLLNAIQANETAGILFVAAAGNGGADGIGDNNDTRPNYPSNYNVANVVAVAALDRNDNLANFSNYGAATVDLGAPGVAVLSTVPGNSYSSFNGTSMATPHVSGVAALAWSVNPSATYQQVRDALYAGTVPVASLAGKSVTGGRLNAFNTLQAIGGGGPTAPKVNSHSPAGTTGGPVSSVDVNFSEGMNAGSFSVASDVVSFTGPGGSNLLPSITGSSWVDGDTLRINFNPQSAVGSYNLTIGPNILDSNDGLAMDQDGNGTPGQTSDRYTAGFSISNIVQYQAASTPYQAINLAPTQAGVFSILDGVDDGNAAVNLGTNTFNFFGTTYTGSQLFASSNGLLTFGSGSSDHVNSDLTSGPSQASIAVLWDDWRTDSSTTNDRVLGKFVDANSNGIPEQLIIEWDGVKHYPNTARVTFQAILSLNTGSTPGNIVLNYPDTNALSATVNNGKSATVGVKNAGAQGSERLLVSYNATNTLIGSGKAILISPTSSVTAASGPSQDYVAAALAQYLATQSAADDDMVDTLARGRSRRR